MGLGGEMPRAPEVFEPKTKWKKYEPVPWPADKENYVSAKENATALQAQFRKEEKLGAMIEVEEAWARQKYRDKLRIVALAALEKSDHTFRCVHDGAHGVGVNAGIQVWDQLNYPGPGEIRAAMEAIHPVTFALAADVSRAHRLVRIREED